MRVCECVCVSACECVCVCVCWEETVFFFPVTSARCYEFYEFLSRDLNIHETDRSLNVIGGNVQNIEHVSVLIGQRGRWGRGLAEGYKSRPKQRRSTETGRYQQEAETLERLLTTQRNKTSYQSSDIC